MNTDVEKIAPYAPFGCVMVVIKRLRERGLPEVLTFQEIIHAGVSEGNVSRTLQALRFLKLVDEEGYHTQSFDRLSHISTNEYTQVFAEIIKQAYHDVFIAIDPANATHIEINDAFRRYHPQAQRSRMITLFKGLCQEVGLMGGGPPETRKRIRHAATGKNLLASQSAASRKPNIDSVYMANLMQGQLSSEQELSLLYGLLQQLPQDKKWTRERRDRWLQAFTANIDLLIDTEQ